jgi:hypothetical protein
MQSNYWYVQLKDIKFDTRAFEVDPFYLKYSKYKYNNCNKTSNYSGKVYQNYCTPSLFSCNLHEAFPFNPCSFDSDSDKSNSGLRIYSKTKKYIDIPIKDVINTPDEFFLSFEENDKGGNFYNTKQDCCNSPVIRGEDAKFSIEIAKVNRRQCNSSSSSSRSSSRSSNSSSRSSQVSNCATGIPEDVEIILTVSGVTGASGVNGTFNLNTGPTGGWSFFSDSKTGWFVSNSNVCCNVKNATATIVCNPLGGGSTFPITYLNKYNLKSEEEIKESFDDWFDLNVEIEPEDQELNIVCSNGSSSAASSSLSFGDLQEDIEIEKVKKDSDCCEDDVYHEVLVYFEIKGLRLLIFRQHFRINNATPLICKIVL